MKHSLPFIMIILFASLFTACGQKDQDAEIAVAIALTQTAAAPAAPASPTVVIITPAAVTPAATGFISGRVHLVAPPTPRMAVYALDPATGLWAYTETTASDGEASFTLAVPPGSYQVFAFSADANMGGYAGHESADGLALATITVAANQTISDIIVRPPSQSECGSMFGVPASPDGRFAEISGPSADCIATMNSTPLPANPEATRIQFQPNATDWYTPGDLAPNATIRFVLNALEGQQMIVDLITEPDSSVIPYATLYIWSADGQGYTPNSTRSWSGELPASQDYYIEVRSLSQQSINYTLHVTIPAAGSTSSQVNQPTQAPVEAYGPVSLAVCQVIQESATQALSATFAMEESAPFTDPVTGETGHGCTLIATGTGNDFSSPSETTANLVSAFLGWTEQPAYQADGPTGSMTAMTRDMGLLLITVDWALAPGVQCPSDQPISSCDLQPEQKIYTIKVQVAQK